MRHDRRRHRLCNTCLRRGPARIQPRARQEDRGPQPLATCPRAASSRPRLRHLPRRHRARRGDGAGRAAGRGHHRPRRLRAVPHHRPVAGRPPASPQQHVLARYRRPGPRRPGPARVRRPHRHDHRPRRRLLRQDRRHRPRPPHRRGSVDPVPAVRDQPGIGRRAQPQDRHHRAGSVRLVVRRSYRPRTGAVDPRARVRRSGALARLRPVADHVHRHPAQRDRADHRLHDAADPGQHRR